MNSEIIQGNFENGEALDIITRIFHVLIKHHENNLTVPDEEKQKAEEEKIRLLQKELFKASNFILLKGKKVELKVQLTIFP